MALTGRAYNVANNIDMNVLKSKEGIKEVLGKLDEVFKEDQNGINGKGNKLRKKREKV